MNITEARINGDFRSEDCTTLLKQADIVVTNPPFSLFNDFYEWCKKSNKLFIIIGNRAAMTNNILFEDIKANILWTGYSTTHHVFFEVPDWYAEQLKADPTRKEGHGNSYKIVGNKVLAEVNACWYTNVHVEKRKETILLVKKYNSKDYPIFDDCEAISVVKVEDIPVDYEGVMGVPMTFLEKYNPDQFEILYKKIPMLDNKKKYIRIFIRRKEVTK